MAQHYHVENPPVVDLVFEGRPTEVGPLVAECIQEMGFDSAYHPEGGIGFSWGPGQEEAARLAIYTCEARYTILPVFYQPYDDETLGRIYEFSTTVTWPCYEAQGYPLDTIPSFEEFRARYHTDRTDAYYPDPAPDALFERCIINIPHDVILPVQ